MASSNAVDPKATEEQIIGKDGLGGLVSGADDIRNADGSSIAGSDVLALQDIDPAMNMKMHLVNNVSSLFRRYGGFHLAQNFLVLLKLVHFDWWLCDVEPVVVLLT